MSIYPVTADEEEVRSVYHILSKVLRLLRDMVKVILMVFLL